MILNSISHFSKLIIQHNYGIFLHFSNIDPKTKFHQFNSQTHIPKALYAHGALKHKTPLL